MKRVAIVQSNYIPWKGYFDIIHDVDEFIIFDDVQYTRRDWRNRNLIKAPNGKRWLTIPVSVKGRYRAININEVAISDTSWAMHHWKAICSTYHRTPYFDAYASKLEELFLESDDDKLSCVNRRFLEGIMYMLGIDTRITWSTEYPGAGRRTERLISLCRAAGATHYLSGPAAQNYIEEEKFQEAGIVLEYKDYSGYPAYEQLYPPFDHAVSIIDLILMCGPHSADHIWGWRSQ